MTASIPGLRFGEFQGLPALLVQTPFSRAAISLFGGHVLSWIPNGFDDVLWLSPVSKRPPDPIRGGIPVCWPYFARQGQPPDAPMHGLVRTLQWQVTHAQQNADGEIVLGGTAVGVPAAQHVLDLGIGQQRVVRRMCLVHGGDVGHRGWPDVVVIVGRDLDTARCLDQPRGVTNEREFHLRRLQHLRTELGALHEPASGLWHRCDGKTAVGHSLLRGRLRRDLSRSRQRTQQRCGRSEEAHREGRDAPETVS